MPWCSSRKSNPIMKSSVIDPTATSILNCLPCIVIGSCLIIRQRMCEPCSAFLMYSRDTVTVGLSDWLINDNCTAVSTSNKVSTAWIYAGINQVWPTVGANCECLTAGSVSCLDPVSTIIPPSLFVSSSVPFIDLSDFVGLFLVGKTLGWIRS